MKYALKISYLFKDYHFLDLIVNKISNVSYKYQHNYPPNSNYRLNGFYIKFMFYLTGLKIKTVFVDFIFKVKNQ